MFDETTDANKRYILHLLGGECCKEIRMRPIRIGKNQLCYKKQVV
jgi:hypothetical protein